MKTLTQTLFATALATVILGTSAMATFAHTSPKTEISKDAASAVTFNKIIVSGNVKVILVQGTKEAIKVDDSFDASKTTIKKNGYKLMIHSIEINPVTITVSVKDLQRIDVSGISSVETKGKFDLKYLQIFMSYSSSASINAKTGSLYTNISDAAELKLSGSTDDHTFIASRNAKADLDHFVCNKAERLTNESIAAISLNRAIVAKAR
ncbi:MAG TPA: DUF2807 domain-containing protein [Pedobacter sp.]|uniref:GIN domain-containing protein n=1 Tax=Pedobacter sp. TaxID=1411316 RepID=UPI002C5A0CB9|nr:DUF2807 domain-containing protein [Pedobacter sp.]HMI05763.1 DUF2807 domain-containing protein [Pedobacter sp.]